MKFFLILAIGLICTASMVDGKKGKDKGKGKDKDKDKGKNDGAMDSMEEDEFIQALAPLMMQVHEIVSKDMDPMMSKKDCGHELKLKVCVGENSAFSEKFGKALEECPEMPDDEEMMELMEMMKDMENMEMRKGQGGKGFLHQVISKVGHHMAHHMAHHWGHHWAPHHGHGQEESECEEEEEDPMAMLKEVMMAKKCFLEKMGWIDEECNPQTEIVKEDIKSTLLGESLSGASDHCEEYADEVIGQLEGVDRKKDKKDDEDMVVGAVRKMVYFGCVHHAMEEACQETTGYILNMLSHEHGWEDSAIMEKLDIEEIPPLVIPKYEYTKIHPGQDVWTYQLLDEPTPYFHADPEAKYTYIVVDFGAPERTDLRFIHYMKVNIPGDDLEGGDVAFAYIPSFTFFPDGQGGLSDDRANYNEHFHFIYRQTQDREVDEDELKCNDNLLSLPRVGQEFEAFAEYDGMELVAASVMKVHYSDCISRALMCQFDTCVADKTNPGLQFIVPASGYTPETCPVDPFYLPPPEE